MSGFNPENMFNAPAIESAEKENKKIKDAAISFNESVSLLKSGAAMENVLDNIKNPSIKIIHNLDVQELQKLKNEIDYNNKFVVMLFERIMEEKVNELAYRLEGGRKSVTTHFGINEEYTIEKDKSEKEAEEILQNLRFSSSKEFYKIAKELMIMLIDTMNKRAEFDEKTRKEKVLKSAVKAVTEKTEELTLAGKKHNEEQLNNIIATAIEGATRILLNKAA